jgi:integrase
LKHNTRTNLRVTRDHLVAFFRAERPMRAITRDEASQWRAKLMASGLAVATVRLYVGNARQFFGEAARRELIPKNPFDHLPAGTTATANERYVTPYEAARVLAACDDPEAKMTFALARYGGLRIPSESHLLTWADVDFEKGRLTVRSPKTERHRGHDKRVVPITPTLMPVLQAAFDAAEEGVPLVVAGPRSNERLRNLVFSAIRRADVEVWEDLFRTLRSSCEREWAMTFPQFAVSKWIGHSITVSGKHYAHHVPDELLTRASGVVVAAQKAAQQPAGPPRSERQIDRAYSPMNAEDALFNRGSQPVAAGCDDVARTGDFGPSSRRP